MIFQKIKTFFALSGRMKLFCLEAFLSQLLTGLILKFIPFKKIPGLFPPPKKSDTLPILSKNDSGLVVEQIKNAICYTGGLSPWRNKCLVQSLAARRMLSRRKIQSRLSLGVTIGQNNKMIAHAWLNVADIEIVEKNGDYHELLHF